MDQVNCFKDLSQSFSDYRKVVFSMFSSKNHVDLKQECGYLQNDIKTKKFKKHNLNKIKSILIREKIKKNQFSKKFLIKK